MHGSGPDDSGVLQALAALTREEPPSARDLSRLCERLSERVGAIGVVVTALGHDGRPWLAHGSDRGLQDLAAQQFALGEGPCVDASRRGAPVLARGAELGARWPAWGPQALEAGVAGVASAPVAGGEPRRPVGTVWAAFEDAGPLADDAALVVATVGAVAVRQLAWSHELAQQREKVRQLERALHSRVLIEQAKGYLAAQLGTTPDHAFERLRRAARSSQRRLHDVAAQALREGASVISAAPDGPGARPPASLARQRPPAQP